MSGPGSIGFDAGQHVCECEGCDNPTKLYISTGERRRYTCRDHEDAVQDELRPERVLLLLDD